VITRDHTPGSFYRYLEDVIARPTAYPFGSWHFWNNLIQECRSHRRKRRTREQRQQLRELRAALAQPRRQS